MEALQHKTTMLEQKALMSSGELFSQIGDSKQEKIICDKHGVQHAKIYYFGDKWTVAKCPKCLENQEKYEQKQKDERNQIIKLEQNKRMIKARMGSSGIPARFIPHSFETFWPANDISRKILGFCKEYADNFSKYRKQGTSLVFCGNTGTGKTHLACSIANHTIENQGSTAVFIKVAKAIRQVKETYGKNSAKSEQEAINWFLIPDLLILDEVGVQFGSDAEKLILFEILNERYEAMKPTILISNLSPENLVAFTGERVMDRMKENGGKVLKFTWESHRGKKVTHLPSKNMG